MPGVLYVIKLYVAFVLAYCLISFLKSVYVLAGIPTAFAENCSLKDCSCCFKVCKVVCSGLPLASLVGVCFSACEAGGRTS